MPPEICTALPLTGVSTAMVPSSNWRESLMESGSKPFCTVLTVTLGAAKTEVCQAAASPSIAQEICMSSLLSGGEQVCDWCGTVFELMPVASGKWSYRVIYR
jgi:hypothetical protein